MELTRDQSCVDRINWRCDLPPTMSGDALFERLSKLEGYRVEGPGPLLYVVRGPDQHQILIVPRTGRVQIRVSYDVPKLERRLAAEKVFATLVRLIHASARVGL